MSNIRSTYSIQRVGLMIAAVIAAVGCSDSAKRPASAIRGEMLNAYGVSAELFPYVWNPSAFSDPQSDKKILALLTELSRDFHQVEQVGSRYSREPGFAVTLTTQQEMLTDIRNRFAEGKKDYANWKMRAISGNCVSCHTRFNVASDFIGSEPPYVGSSFENRRAVADFLLATRQFDRAADAYLRLAQSMGSVASGSASALEMLKQWLVIEVRVKARDADAAEILAHAVTRMQLHPDERRIAERWVSDLKTPAPANLSPIEFANRELSGSEERTIDEDQANLVTTLRVTAQLHKSLETETSPEIRREAQYLLAFAYIRTPIQSLEIFREPYLEQAIRGNPGTAEAQKAYRLYKTLVENESTGTGGLHLDAESKEKLDQLRSIAFVNVKP